MTFLYAHVCPHTLISVSGEDSRSLLRHLAALVTVAHWVTHSVGVLLRTHKAARGVSSLKTLIRSPRAIHRPQTRARAGGRPQTIGPHRRDAAGGCSKAFTPAHAMCRASSCKYIDIEMHTVEYDSMQLKDQRFLFFFCFCFKPLLSFFIRGSTTLKAPFTPGGFLTFLPTCPFLATTYCTFLFFPSTPAFL